MVKKQNELVVLDNNKSTNYGEDETPDEIIDMVSYRQYNELKTVLSDKSKTHFNTSDVNVIVNLMAGVYFIDKKISHLPIEEQDEIRLKAKEIRVVKGKYTQAKKRAFGVHNGTDKFLLSSRKDEIIELFGRFHTIGEVHQVVMSDWGLDVNIATVNNFRLRYIDQIRERQDEYKREFSDLRLGYKRSRLDELTYLYNSRKQKYRTTEGKEDYKLLLLTLEQIKREVEGDRIVIDGNITMDLESTVNDHIQEEIMKQLNIVDIIVARVAARTNTDARFLIGKLRSSYYAKFTGFLKPDNSLMEDEVIYPSKSVYNFDEIERLHKSGQMNEGPIEEPNIEIVKEGKSFKERILAKIQEKKNKVEVATKDLDNHLRKEEEPSKEIKKKEKDDKEKKKPKVVLASYRQKRKK